MAFIVTCSYLSIQHLSYPYEIDWFEGAVLEHSLQVVDGKEIYAEPRVDFVSSLYQPLYLYVAAAVMKLNGVSYFAGRVISVFSAVGVAILLLLWSRRTTQGFIYPLACVGLFLGAYDITGYTLSLARVDVLLLLLIVASYFVLAQKVNTVTVIIAGLLSALAFFTKQQALFFMPLLGCWLLARNVHLGLIYGAVTALAIGIGISYVQSRTDGWYLFYVLEVPRAKSGGFGWIRTLTIVPLYLLRYWGAGMIAILLFLTTQRGRLKDYLRSEHSLILIFFLGAVIQAAMHRGDQMSYTNVYIPLAAAGALAITFAVYQLSTTAEFSLAATGALCLQLITLLYDPRIEPKILVNDQYRRADAEFISMLSQMPGEVTMPGHGFLQRLAGKKGNAFELFTLDVLLTRGPVANRLKARIDSAYATHAFGTILIDSNNLVIPDSIPGYTFSGKLTHARFGSRIGSSLTKPTYIYQPKHL